MGRSSDDSAHGLEVVPADRAGAFVVRLDGMDQSYVDLEDPTRLSFPYVRRLGDLVDAYAPAGERLRVVHVGGAGLTLPRYVAATRPSSAQIVLEPDAVSTERVRAALPLPARSGIKVRPLEGRTGLAGLGAAYADLVVVDAFAGGRVPGDLVTAQCAAELARVLVPAGWALLNLVDRAPFAWSRRAVAALRTSFAEVVVIGEVPVLRGRRAGNLVVAVAHTPVPVGRIRPRVGADGGYRLLDNAAVRDTLGGGTAFTDADTVGSPP